MIVAFPRERVSRNLGALNGITTWFYQWNLGLPGATAIPMGQTLIDTSKISASDYNRANSIRQSFTTRGFIPLKEVLEMIELIYPAVPAPKNENLAALMQFAKIFVFGAGYAKMMNTEVQAGKSMPLEEALAKKIPYSGNLRPMAIFETIKRIDAAYEKCQTSGSVSPCIWNLSLPSKLEKEYYSTCGSGGSGGSTTSPMPTTENTSTISYPKDWVESQPLGSFGASSSCVRPRNPVDSDYVAGVDAPSYTHVFDISAQVSDIRSKYEEAKERLGEFFNPETDEYFEKYIKILSNNGGWVYYVDAGQLVGKFAWGSTPNMVLKMLNDAVYKSMQTVIEKLKVKPVSQASLEKSLLTASEESHDIRELATVGTEFIKCVVPSGDGPTIIRSGIEEGSLDYSNLSEEKAKEWREYYNCLEMNKQAEAEKAATIPKLIMLIGATTMAWYAFKKK